MSQEKMWKDSCKVCVTAEEARKYLKGETTLLFDGRLVKNLAKCVNCSKRGRQSVHWDI